MKSCFLSLLILALASLSSVRASPPGKGHGQGGGEFRGVIHSLFAKHEDFIRKVELHEKGYRAETTSENPESAKLLQKHVAQMEERLEGGLSVRHWDPAFAELIAHYEDMTIEVKNIKGGVAVFVIGKTPEAIQVAQNHATIISGFIDKGESQMHATHAAVVAAAEVTKGEKSGAVVASACGCAKGKGTSEGKEKGTGCGKNCGGSCGKGSPKAGPTEPEAE